MARRISWINPQKKKCVIDEPYRPPRATGSSSSSTPKTTKEERNNSARHAKEGLGAGGAGELRSNRRLLVESEPPAASFATAVARERE